MKHDNGGPSFPVYESETHYAVEFGMTLHDWLVGQIVPVLCAGPGCFKFTGGAGRHVADRDQRYDETNWAEIVVSNASNFADAIITNKRRREKENEEARHTAAAAVAHAFVGTQDQCLDCGERRGHKTHQ